MALTHWAFIYIAPGADPATHSKTVDTGQLRSDLIAVDHPEQALEVARKAVADGAQLIELCGAFDLFDETWRGRIAEAIDESAPVGRVSYSPDAAARVAEIAGIQALE